MYFHTKKSGGLYQRGLSGNALKLAGSGLNIAGSGLNPAGAGECEKPPLGRDHIIPGSGLKKKIAPSALSEPAPRKEAWKPLPKTREQMLGNLPKTKRDISVVSAKRAQAEREFGIKISKSKSKSVVQKSIQKQILKKKPDADATAVKELSGTMAKAITSTEQGGDGFFDFIAAPFKAVIGIGKQMLGLGPVEDVVDLLISAMAKELKLKRVISKKALKVHVRSVLAGDSSEKDIAKLLLLVIEGSLIKQGKTISHAKDEMLEVLEEAVEKAFSGQVGSGLFSSLFGLAKKLLPKIIKPLGNLAVKAVTKKVGESEWGKRNPNLVGAVSGLASKGVNKLDAKYNV